MQYKINSKVPNSPVVSFNIQVDIMSRLRYGITKQENLKGVILES